MGGKSLPTPYFCGYDKTVSHIVSKHDDTAMLLQGFHTVDTLWEHSKNIATLCF